MTLDKNAVSKLEELGPMDYIKYELHDSDNALMVVPVKEIKEKGIEKLINQNENALKGN